MGKLGESGWILRQQKSAAEKVLDRTYLAPYYAKSTYGAYWPVIADLKRHGSWWSLGSISTSSVARGASCRRIGIRNYLK